MVMCFVPLCKHYSEQKTCKFFCFPADPQEKKKWINRIRREDREPSKYSLVCSCHFEKGERKNGPTLFEHNIKRKFQFVSPEKRKRTAKPKQNNSMRNLIYAFEGTGIGKQPSTSSSSSSLVSETSTPNSADNGGSASSITAISSGACLDAENYFFRGENESLHQQLSTAMVQFSYENIKSKDALVLMYTGMPSAKLFEILFQTMERFNLNYYAGWNVEKIPKIDQLLLTLMKLRLNLPHEDLALRFNCSSATVTNIVMTWLHALHEVVLKQLMANIPSRKRNQACLPSAFSSFTNCRIILDCTEIYSAVPKSMEKQRLTYSSYKHRNTWRILVGVAPNGVITYVSSAYPGSISDKRIVENCGILQKLCAGDLVLADKGFLISNLLPPGVNLNIPPFLNTPQFTEKQVYETQRIARARIHVERAIRRIKCFNILDRIPQYFIPQVTVIIQVCAALTNFQHPLIKEVEEYFT